MDEAQKQFEADPAGYIARWEANRPAIMRRTSEELCDITVNMANALNKPVSRLDMSTLEVTALTAGEENPTLAVLFVAGLSNAQRNAVMRAIISVPGVCVVETLDLYNEIVALPDPMKTAEGGFDLDEFV